MKKIKPIKEMVIYQTKTGALELKGDFSRETMWATQAQIATIFGIERSVVTKHINNVLKLAEIDKKKQCAIFAHCKFRQAGRFLFTRHDFISRVSYQFSPRH
jgi:hypothetical protein